MYVKNLMLWIEKTNKNLIGVNFLCETKDDFFVGMKS